VDFDAGTRPLGQRLGKLPADLSRPVDVGLECDRALRAANCLEHGRENLIAIDQTADTVAGEDGRPDQVVHRPQKLRVAHRVFMIELVADSTTMKSGAAGNSRKKKQPPSELRRQGPSETRRTRPVHRERIVLSRPEFPTTEPVKAA
jgi:hypothetical protein